MDMDFTETKKTVYEKVTEILGELGHYSQYQEEYSGRGMKGEHTPAIITNSNQFTVGWAITIVCRQVMNLDFDPDTSAYMLLPQHYDQMGVNRVYY